MRDPRLVNHFVTELMIERWENMSGCVQPELPCLWVLSDAVLNVLGPVARFEVDRVLVYRV